MKKILAFSCALLLCAGLYAQGVDFRDIGFEQAMQMAQQEQKPIFMDCYTSWCGPCRYMTTTVFPTEEAGKYFNATFVNVKYDMEKGEGKELAKKYAVRAYPTFLILNADGTEINRTLGSTKTAAEFIEKIKKAMNPMLSPAARLATYQSHPSYDNAKDYLEALDAAYLEKDMVEFMKTEWKRFEIYELFGNDMFKFFKKIWAEDPASLAFTLEHKADAVQYCGSKEMVDQSLCFFYQKQLQEWLSGKKEFQSATVADYIEKLKMLQPKDDSVLTWILMASEAVQAGNLDPVYASLNPKMMDYLYNYNEIMIIEGMVANMKNIDEAKLKAYFEAKVKQTEMHLEVAKKKLARYAQ